MNELRGRNAILTGASRGLGVHIARTLAREGINVALAARSTGALEEVRDEVRALGVKAVAIPTDLAETTQVEALAEEAERQLGSVDILVNNAGVQRVQAYEEYPPEKIELSVRVNLLAAMLLTRAVLPGMLTRGRGQIVNISSLAGKIGFPNMTPYATTKAGLVMFTRSLRAELVDQPVVASVICPGFIDDSGMYARRSDVEAPRLLMPTTTDKVVAAVMKALKQEAAELIVNPLPMRPLIILREAVSGITPRIHKAIGTTDLAREVSIKSADEHRP